MAFPYFNLDYSLLLIFLLLEILALALVLW